MGESVGSLFRRGVISPKQIGKVRVPLEQGVLKKTKVERPEEEAFHGAQGLKDQARGKERGKSEVAGRKHINTKQEAGSKHFGFKDGKPSKDGFVKNGRGGALVAGPDEINQRGTQKPDIPRSAGMGSKVSKGGDDTNAMDDKRGQDSWGKRPIPNAPKKKLKPSQGGSNKFASKKAAKMGGMYGGGGRDTQ